jgi:hypothetical protein
MADAVVGTKHGAPNSLNYSSLHADQNCERCTELQKQLQQVRDELFSVKLIVQMLNKEHIQKDTTATHIDHTGANRQEDESWEIVAEKRAQKQDQKVT